MSGNTQSRDREALLEGQLKRLRAVLAQVLDSNAFYGRKLRDAGIEGAGEIGSLEDFGRLPFTTKAELSEDQAAHSPYGTNLTFTQDRYIRVHQTSGTSGTPLRWLDTEESWDWFARCWTRVYAGAGVTAADRLLFAFSFGPFIGFWTAHEAARLTGAMSISGGAMSSAQRLHAIADHQATVLVCTPTYALHLAEVAEDEGIDVAASSVTTTIHAGEPGAGLPATRDRIEEAWGAKCFDHAGATEVGAWGFQCPERDGLHVNEEEFICEVVDPETGQAADAGELVLTNLGRVGMPVIRYRTGDRVTLDATDCGCGSVFRKLKGGVEGRIDDALIVRGVNVYPSAIENVVRGFPGISEFAVDVYRRNEMDAIEIRVEADASTSVHAVGREIRRVLGLRPRMIAAAGHSLPRYEMKASRFTDHRKTG